MLFRRLIKHEKSNRRLHLLRMVHINPISGHCGWGGPPRRCSRTATSTSKASYMSYNDTGRVRSDNDNSTVQNGLLTPTQKMCHFWSGGWVTSPADPKPRRAPDGAWTPAGCVSSEKGREERRNGPAGPRGAGHGQMCPPLTWRPQNVAPDRRVWQRPPPYSE